MQTFGENWIKFLQIRERGKEKKKISHLIETCDTTLFLDQIASIVWDPKEFAENNLEEQQFNRSSFLQDIETIKTLTIKILMDVRNILKQIL